MNIFFFTFLFSIEFMKIEEIQSGMKGYGLTVFKGTKVDTFEVEIVDIIKKGTPKGDIILAKISGGPIDTTGVIAGMSGSPVYIGEKLVGGIAYNYGLFPKKAYVGITPIKEMLSPPSLGRLPLLEEFNFVKLPLNYEIEENKLIEEVEKLFPGVKVVQMKMNLEEVKVDTYQIQPGMALGVLLVEGDFNIYAMGTCTYRQGEQVWAFGHPFGLLGKTTLPMIGGYVYSVIPSSYFSYKICAPTQIIGTIEEDNSRGIVGKIGVIPEMMEFKVNIKGKEFCYSLVKDKRIAPVLVDILIFLSVSTGFSLPDIGSFATTFRVEGEDGFCYNNLLVGNIQTIIQNIGGIFREFYNNPFKKVNIETMEVKLEPLKGVRLGVIQEVTVDKKEVSPGDTLIVRISIFKHRDEEEIKLIPVEIPSYICSTDLFLEVKNGTQYSLSLKKQITSFSSLLKWLNTSPSSTEIILSLTQTTFHGKILGKEFEALPLSKAYFLKNKRRSKLWEKRIKTDYKIMGRKEVRIKVK